MRIGLFVSFEHARPVAFEGGLLSVVVILRYLVQSSNHDYRAT